MIYTRHMDNLQWIQCMDGNHLIHSYAQGGDEEFWSKLSPEEQVKTRELLAKIKEGKKGDDVAKSESSDINSVDDGMFGVAYDLI